MKKSPLRQVCRLAASALAIFGSFSCVNIDGGLGSNLIPLNDLYDIYSAEFPLTDIQMKMLDSLSGYSNTRITIGAIRDAEFGLTTRGCALSLVPIPDTLDFGRDPKFKEFHFTAAPDTVSVADTRQKNILQNINVYELSDPMNFNLVDLRTPIKHKTKRVTDGVPTYNGKDSLSFNFSKEFGEKYMGIKLNDLSDMETYLKSFPGIYIDTDVPEGLGGRIDMFELQLGLNLSQGYISKNYAELKFNSEYEGVRKDTSFLFYLSPNDMLDLDSLATIKNNYSTYKFPQNCFNSVSHESTGREVRAAETIHIEGGGGVKPVFSAQEIMDKVKAEVSKHGDPKTVVINRATIVLPFEFPDDYKEMYKYPDYLSPTCRISYPDGVSYGSLTDVSSESEDPGKINRSLLQYAPDVTFHVQKLMNLSESAKISNYDIWCLLMSIEEYVTENDNSLDAMSDYYNYLSYMSYYNNMYGGYGGYGGYGMGMYGMGYGGYGGYGYGGYGGYGMSNYYSYMLASQYANANSGSSKSTSIEMDVHRYFNAILNGPEAKNGRVPVMKIVYAVPKQ